MVAFLVEDCNIFLFDSFATFFITWLAHHLFWLAVIPFRLLPVTATGEVEVFFVTHCDWVVDKKS